MRRFSFAFVALLLWSTPVLAQFPMTVSKVCFGNCSTGPTDLVGTTANPDGFIAACVGSTYRRTNGGTSTTFWIKDTGGCTSSGWTALVIYAGTTNSYITKVAEANLSNEFALGSLATGLLKNTTTTGVPTIATAGTDYVAPAVGTVGTLIPDADATRDVGTSSARWATSYFTQLFVGNNTPSFVTPTHYVDARQTVTGTLGATNYALGDLTLTMTPTTSAPSGQYRALEMHVLNTGTLNQTGEVTAGLFSVENSTTGTVTEENGGLFAAQRSAGPSTTSQGIRVDRNYTGAATVVANSHGVKINAPVLTSSATITQAIGLYMQNQQPSGVTNGYQIVSEHANSGYWHLFSTGESDWTNTYTTNAVSALGSRTYMQHAFNYTGGDPSASLYPFNFDANYTASAHITGSVSSVNANVNLLGTNKADSAQGHYGAIYPQGSAGCDATDVPANFPCAGVFGEYYSASTYATPRAAAVAGTVGVASGKAAGTTRVFLAMSPEDTAGAPTTNVGVDIEDQTWAGSTTSFAFRVASSNTGSANQGIMATGAPFDAVKAVTVADNGGGTNAASTVVATAGQVEITCNDAQGCDITLSETGIVRGQRVTFVCLVGICNFADTAGVSETAGAFAAGVYDAISYRYIADRWVETGRSNN